MIAREQHGRNVDAAEGRRPGVAGIVDRARRNERFFAARVFRDRAVEQPDRRIEKRERGNFTAGQNEITKRKRFHRIEVGETFVDPLVVAADHDQAVECGERLRVGLHEGPARGGGEDDPAPFLRRGGGEDRIEGPRERFDPQHHPGAAAVGPLVGSGAGLAGGDQIVNDHGDEAALDGPADDREPDDRGEHLGKERDDVDAQHRIVTIFAKLGRFAWKPRSSLAAASAALERGDFADALALVDRALAEAESATARAAAHNKRGVVLVRAADRDGATLAFLAALEAEPRHVPAIVNVGNLLLESGMTADAIEHYEAALRLDDRYAPAYQNLGVAFRRLGRRSESVRALRAAGRLASRLNLRRKTTEA